MKGWSWEIYWILGGVFSWIVAPWAVSLAILPQTLDILKDADATTLFWTFFFGVLWGVGGPSPLASPCATSASPSAMR